MQILLTGVTGFIGSHLARFLVQEKHNVYALIRPQSDLWRIQDILPQLKPVTANLLNLNEVYSYLEKIRPELCIHMAWYAVPGKYLHSTKNIEMLNATVRLAAHLENLGCRKFIGIGTCFEYDTSLGYLSETSLTRPNNLYAACKLAAQMILAQLANISKMQVAWLRLFYQYGPFEHQKRLVPAVICELLQNQPVKVTKGEQVRDFLYIEDVVAAIWAVSQSNLTGPVNIGSGRPVQVRELVAQIGKLLNRLDLVNFGALPYRESDPMFVCANNRLLVEHTGWQPRYGLKDGLAQTVTWWKHQME